MDATHECVRNEFLTWMLERLHEEAERKEVEDRGHRGPRFVTRMKAYAWATGVAVATAAASLF